MRECVGAPSAVPGPRKELTKCQSHPTASLLPPTRADTPPLELAHPSTEREEGPDASSRFTLKVENREKCGRSQGEEEFLLGT